MFKINKVYFPIKITEKIITRQKDRNKQQPTTEFVFSKSHM